MSQNLGVSFVVIFGSAVAYCLGESTRMPRDIDVAFGGSIHSQADAEAIAHHWAQAHGLGHLPVDAHREYVWDDTLTLPVPAGLTGSAVVLVGQTFLRVQWREVTTTSAIIRALGSDPEACALALAAHWLPVTLQPTRPGEFPVAVFTCPGYFPGAVVVGDREISRAGDGWIDFQIVPGACAGDLGPDSVYTGEGVDALRRAITHCTPAQWAETTRQLRALHPTLRGVASFLRRISRRDLPAGGQAAIIRGTSGASGFGCIRFQRGQAATAYAGPIWPLARMGTAPWKV